MDRHDISMLEFSDRASFLLKAFQEYGVAGMIGRQHFDSHVSIKVGLIGFEDRSHATRPDTLDYTKLPERFPNQNI